MNDKWIGIIAMVICTIITVGLYFGLPFIKVWVSRVLVGWKGALILYGIGIVLFAVFALGFGLEGKSLWYVLGVIVFAFSCIWLMFNYDMFVAWLEAHLGVWGMTGVLLLVGLLVWIGTLFL